MIDPESLVQLGAACIHVARYLQRTYPAITRRGSQCEEDEILARLLPQADGCYVDVGANHGIQCSNTWQFYQRGWRGLLIEPLSERWKELVEDRIGDYFSFKAAGATTGPVFLKLLRDQSSIVPDVDNDQQLHAVMELDTLANILSRYPLCVRDKCRLCSIDVEGWEKDVLEGVDWNTFRPEVFCIEWKQPHTDDMTEAEKWLPILTGHGYSLAGQTAYNLILKR